MSSTNKKGAGLILSLLTAVAGAVGLGFCIVNAGTDSFRKIGTSPVVIGCAVIAILALVLRVVLDKKLAIAADVMDKFVTQFSLLDKKLVNTLLV